MATRNTGTVSPCTIRTCAASICAANAARNRSTRCADNADWFVHSSDIRCSCGDAATFFARRSTPSSNASGPAATRRSIVKLKQKQNTAQETATNGTRRTGFLFTGMKRHLSTYLDYDAGRTVFQPLTCHGRPAPFPIQRVSCSRTRCAGTRTFTRESGSPSWLGPTPPNPHLSRSARASRTVPP